MVVVGGAGDQTLVASLIERHGVDAVIHLAGIVPDSVRDPLSYYRNNTTISVIGFDQTFGDTSAKGASSATGTRHSHLRFNRERGPGWCENFIFSSMPRSMAVPQDCIVHSLGCTGLT
jgi:hypothetical protein